jgi:hypothetical protein
MTHTEHPRNGGLTLFLAFVGGALVASLKDSAGEDAAVSTAAHR